MADDSTTPQPQPPQPNPDLRRLDRLVGTWNVAGGAQGQVTYQWMDGGFFLIRHVELEQYGQKSKRSLGNSLDDVYELEGDTLTIWGGEKGSPASYTGRLSDDGNTVTGDWVYPGGGGYRSTVTRAGP
jgi:hypothetical protein